MSDALNREFKYSPIPFALISLFIILIIYQISGIILFLFIEQTPINLKLTTIFSQLLFLFIPTYLLSKLQFGNFKSIAKWRIPSNLEIVLIVASVISLTIFLEGLLILQSNIPFPAEIKKVIQIIEKMYQDAIGPIIFAKNIWEQILVFLTVAIVPAICEEILFRGFLQNSLTLKNGSKFGVIMSGVIFGLFHLNPVLIVPLVLMGIFFSYLNFATGSIVSSIIAHLTNNTLMLLLVIVFPSQMSYETEYTNEIVLSAIIPMMIFSISVFFILIRLLKRKEILE